VVFLKNGFIEKKSYTFLTYLYFYILSKLVSLAARIFFLPSKEVANCPWRQKEVICMKEKKVY